MTPNISYIVQSKRTSDNEITRDTPYGNRSTPVPSRLSLWPRGLGRLSQILPSRETEKIRKTRVEVSRWGACATIAGRGNALPVVSLDGLPLTENGSEMHPRFLAKYIVSKEIR